MKLIMLQLMVGKPFDGGRRNGKGKLLQRSSLQVRRHTQKNQEQPTHNLYEDDQGLDEKEDEKSDAVLDSVSIATTHRTNAMEMGQFERTLTVTDDRSFVEYLEEYTVPSYDMNQLDAAVVELHCNEEAEIKYLTVQNWYAGNENGKGGIYNFVIKKDCCNLNVGEEKDILKLLSTKQIGETCDTLSLTKLEQLIAFRTAAE
ncbi:UPF0051 protein ABCI8, chloroplastic-like protein [Tanacetum coccineum]